MLTEVIRLTSAFRFANIVLTSILSKKGLKDEPRLVSNLVKAGARGLGTNPASGRLHAGPGRFDPL